MKSFDKLASLITTLRGSNGCPWDKEQTFDSASKYLISEMNEVKQALVNKDFDNLKEELGDLLFNILFISDIAEEQKLFTLEEIIEIISNKIIRRHPHVFGNEKITTKEDVSKRWEEIKQKEKLNGPVG